VDELCMKLKDQTLSTRIRGLAALGLGFADTKQAKKQAADALFEILEDEAGDEFVDWCVVEALTRFSQGVNAGPPDDQVGQSRARRTDLEASIGRRARKLYERKGSDNANYSRLRARAVYLLGWLTEGTATGKLMRRALDDKNPFVRGYIVEAMARRDIMDARRTIEDQLSVETHPFVLRKAAEALGQIGTVESILVLEKYLRSQQASARWSARAAIHEIKERYAL